MWSVKKIITEIVTTYAPPTQELILCKSAAEVFRHVPKATMNSILHKIAALYPSPPDTLTSFQDNRFSDAIFLTEDWELHAMRFLFNGDLSKDKYAALMLFSDCQHTLTFLPNVNDVSLEHSFTSMDTSSVKEFGKDFIEACKDKFPQEKLEAFIASLQFNTPSDDCILVLNGGYLTPLIKRINKVDSLLKGEKGTYVLSPATMKKFMGCMATDKTNNPTTKYTEDYFRAIDLDCVHCLGKPEDFEKPDYRIVFIPNKYIPNPSIIHDKNTINDGLGIYIHDAYAHILSSLCHVPISHANIWIAVALKLKKQYFSAYNKILDFSIYYNPTFFTEQFFSPEFCAIKTKTDTQIFNENLQLTLELPWVRDLDNKVIYEVLKTIPDLLENAGVCFQDLLEAAGLRLENDSIIEKDS